MVMAGMIREAVNAPADAAPAEGNALLAFERRQDRRHADKDSALVALVLKGIAFRMWRTAGHRLIALGTVHSWVISSRIAANWVSIDLRKNCPKS
jgi:hypothetical protein